MPTDPLRLTALMASALPPPDAAKWEEQMRAVITRGHLAAWMAGTAERLGVPVDSALLSRARLSRAERNEIKAIVEKQLQYLRGFEKARDGMSEAQVAARSDLYPGALKSTYYGARWGDWEIPQSLMPGNQTCITRCRCSIAVKDHGDGTGTLTRTMHGSENHCTECPPLQGDHPVKRQGAATKHMPGGHDQRSHGRSTARRRASRAAYRQARAGGASIADARAIARTAGLARQGERDARLARMQARAATTPRPEPAHKGSPEARAALDRVNNAEAEIERIKEPLRDRRREIWDEESRLLEQRSVLKNEGKTKRSREIREIDARLAELDAENQRTLKEVLDLDERARRSMLRATDEPGNIGLRFSPNMTPERQREVEQVINETMYLTNSRGLRGTKMQISEIPGTRAFAENWGDDFIVKGRIALDGKDSPRVIAHELGHHMEFRDPTIRDRARAFLDARTRGETPVQLREYTRNHNYGPDEVATPDRFIDSYMGKRYGDGSTEIISMGVEYFYSDPMGLAKRDPEYFMFIYDVLRGT